MYEVSYRETLVVRCVGCTMITRRLVITVHYKAYRELPVRYAIFIHTVRVSQGGTGRELLPVLRECPDLDGPFQMAETGGWFVQTNSLTEINI